MRQPQPGALREPGAILLVSTYELGHQPLGLAWPKAFLERAGYAPAALDLAVEPLDADTVRRAGLVAISVPMHTALRLGARAAEQVRRLNSTCRIVFYGLYALLNAAYLRTRGADAVLGGELEEALVAGLLPGGAGHPPFGAPDFWTAPRHAVRLVHALHDEFPNVSYDFTAKIEHVLEHRGLFREFALTGCAFLVSAVESLSDTVLARLEKGHTKADVVAALDILRDAGIPLRPSFVPFTPWSTLDDYLELLGFVEREGLIDHVDAVQYTIRLLVPPGSLLLSRPAIRPLLGALDPAAFTHRWLHPDPRMDELQREASALVERAAGSSEDAWTTFYRLRALAEERGGLPRTSGGVASPPPERPIPARLTEPWFCLAEPTRDPLG